MQADLTMDWAWGSCGKGGVTGWLAMRHQYDSVVCSYGTQAGHTYNNERHGIHMMVQQLPVGIISKSVKNVFIGPGALINAGVLLGEIDRYRDHLRGKRLMIHEHAVVVEDRHADDEMAAGYTKIGSTAKGVGRAAIERIERNPENPNCARHRFAGTALERHVVSRAEYDAELSKSKYLLIEGAQGFSLSCYHGDYPYCTSRDVTPWQIAADCALPWSMAPEIAVLGVARTHPIRVNNRDGSSGPAYPGQRELTWEEIGKAPEKTTVTKLDRRIFEFSMDQFDHADFHCGSSRGGVVITFADYCKSFGELDVLMKAIHKKRPIKAVVFGPDDADVVWVDRVPLGSAMHMLRHTWEAKQK